jgi:hypothetical protein
LLRVDYNTLFSEGNPNLATSRLIHYCGYLRFDNLAAVEFDPDARAEAVIHSGSIILDLNSFQMRPEMTLTVIAARRRKVAADMELLVAKGADLDFPDELVPQLVVNAFTDDRTLESLGRNGRIEEADKNC